MKRRAAHSCAEAAPVQYGRDAVVLSRGTPGCDTAIACHPTPTSTQYTNQSSGRSVQQARAGARVSLHPKELRQSKAKKKGAIQEAFEISRSAD